MFVEFFDAIDDLSDNEQLEGTSGNHGIIQEVHTGNQYGKRHESTSNCAQLFRQSSVPSWGSQNHLGNASIYRECILLIHVEKDANSHPPHMVVRSKGSWWIEDSLLRIYNPSPSPFAVPPRMGLGLVIPKLKTDGEISAHYNIPLPALQQLKVKCWMRLGGHGNLWCFRLFIFVFKGGIDAASCSLGSHVDKSCAPFCIKHWITMHFQNYQSPIPAVAKFVFLIASGCLWHEVSPAFPHENTRWTFQNVLLQNWHVFWHVRVYQAMRCTLDQGFMTRWVSSHGVRGNVLFFCAMDMGLLKGFFTIGRKLFTPFLCLFDLYVLTYDLFETLNESTTPRKASKLIAAYLEWRKGISKWPCLGWTSSKKRSFTCKITFFQLIWPCF